MALVLQPRLTGGKRLGEEKGGDGQLHCYMVLYLLKSFHCIHVIGEKEAIKLKRDTERDYLLQCSNP